MWTKHAQCGLQATVNFRLNLHATVGYEGVNGACGIWATDKTIVKKMSTRVIKRTRDPLETLERMLQKTTLTTQRLTHSNIIGKSASIA